jgi:hypothetical protein
LEYALGNGEFAITNATTRMGKHMRALAVTLAAILILAPSQVTKRSHVVKGQYFFRGSPAVNENPML